MQELKEVIKKIKEEKNKGWINLFWKTRRKIFWQPIGRLFYQDRVDAKGEILPPRFFFSRINQWLVEKGLNLPWLSTKEECHIFWKLDANNDKDNKPSAYANKDLGIIKFLDNFWSSSVRKTDSILELGCNCGANLNYLYNAGYRNLSGIDINPKAIEQAERSFPNLMKISKINIGMIEDLLATAPPKSVDVIFTTAVLFHIHPRSNSVFKDMTRVARKHIGIIENEIANCNFVFSRNYKRVFEKLGCKQLKEAIINKDDFPYISRGYDGYAAKLFRV